jgi:hypothetical protein
MHTTNFSIPGTLTVILTGDGGTGKTRQAASVFEVADDRGENLFGPVAFVKTESSSEGTADRLFADEQRCVLVDIPGLDLETARDIILDLFPAGGAPATVDEARAVVHRYACKAADIAKQPHPPAPPRLAAGGQRRLRGLAIDTGSTLYRNQIFTEQRKAEEHERATGKDKSAKQGQLASRNTRELAKRAQPLFTSFVSTLSEVGNRHRGLVIVVTIHHRARYQVSKDASGEVQRTQIGVGPDVGSIPDVADGLATVMQSANWDFLAAKANAIWALFPKIPSLARVDPAQVNLAHQNGVRPRFCAVTDRFRDVPDLGHVLWTKRQEGVAWASALGEVPPLWDPDTCNGSGPDLGLVLAETAARARQ